MRKGLTRDEDTALRCLAVLAESGMLTEENAILMGELRARDRRAEIRSGDASVTTDPQVGSR